MTYGKPNPISTAPRDGTEIIVTDGHERWTAMRLFIEDREFWVSTFEGEPYAKSSIDDARIVGWWPMPEAGYPEEKE